MDPGSFPLIVPAVADGGTGRELAAVLADLAAGRWRWAVAGSLGVAALGLLGVVVTSTVFRRPASPPDPTLKESRNAFREGYDEGVRDAKAFRFRDPQDVAETLARVALSAIRVGRGDGVMAIELDDAPSSRTSRTRGKSKGCLWETGFLEAGLGRFAEGSLVVREVECRAAGAKRCRFEIRGRLSG